MPGTTLLLRLGMLAFFFIAATIVPVEAFRCRKRHGRWDFLRQEANGSGFSYRDQSGNTYSSYRELAQARAGKLTFTAGTWAVVAWDEYGPAVIGPFPDGPGARLLDEIADEYGFAHPFVVDGPNDPRLTFDAAQWVRYRQALIERRGTREPHQGQSEPPTRR